MSVSHPLLIFETVTFTEPVACRSAGLAVQRDPPRHSYQCLPSPTLQAHIGFYMDAVDTDSGPHVWAISITI